MKLTTRIALAGLAGATALTGLAAAPAAARSSVSIEYRDRDYRDGRHDRRDWRDHRYYDRRYDRRGHNRYGYRDSYRCWTEWRMAGRYDRYQVRVCR